MSSCKEVNRRHTWIGRIPHGAGLLEELSRLCVEHDVRLGRLEAIGAVQKARISYYDQGTHEYREMAFDQPMEIAKLTGNVSLKDGRPFVHAHVTLADSRGRAFGGHLCPGTVVFACEFLLEAFEGDEFRRVQDDQTGLSLWTFPPETGRT